MDMVRLLSNNKKIMCLSLFFSRRFQEHRLCTSIVRIISEYSVVKIVGRSGRGLRFKCYHGICSEGLSNSTQSI